MTIDEQLAAITRRCMQRALAAPSSARVAGGLWRFGMAPVRPDGATYDAVLGEFVLPYEMVRRAASPDAALLEFLQSTYEATVKELRSREMEFNGAIVDRGYGLAISFTMPGGVKIEHYAPRCEKRPERP